MKLIDLLSSTSNTTQKIEFYTKQLISSNADKQTLVDVALYEAMIGTNVVSILAHNWKLKVNP